MKLFRSPRLILITGLLSLFAFCCDVLDDVCDRGCRVLASQVSQSSGQHKGTCPNFAGHNHDEAAIIASSFVPLSMPMAELLNWPVATERAPSRMPASIDHPPQLS
jgi:hypothetical protein